MSTLQRARRAAGGAAHGEQRAVDEPMQRRAFRAAEQAAAHDSGRPCAPSAAAPVPRPPPSSARPPPLRCARARGMRAPRRGARFGVPHGEVRERRPGGFAALDERERREGRVVAVEQALEQRMIRIVGLNHDLAGAIGAPGAARDLQDRLREPLVAARIGAEQPLVGVQHADERDAREVMALRQHLRADQNLDVARFDVVQHGGERALAARAVAIEPRDARRREQRGELVADALRAGADGDSLAAARAARPARAGARRRSDGSARRPLSRARSCARRSVGIARSPCSCGQNNAGAKPRRFRNSSTWLPAVRCWPIAATNGVDSACRLAWRFRSTTRTRGAPALPMRRGSAQLPVAALRRVVERLERRRRGAEHDGHVQALRAHDGEIARRVAKAASAACTRRRAPRRR